MWNHKVLACIVLLLLTAVSARGQDPLAIDITFELKGRLLAGFFGKQPNMEMDTSRRIAEVFRQQIGYWDFRGCGGKPAKNAPLDTWLVSLPASTVELRIRCKRELPFEVIKPGDKEMLSEDGQLSGKRWPDLIARRLEKRLLVPEEKLIDRDVLPFLGENAPLCIDIRAVPGSSTAGVLPLAPANKNFAKLSDLGKACFRIRGTLDKQQSWLYSEGTGITEGFPPNAVQFQGIVVRHVEWENAANPKGPISAKVAAQLGALNMNRVQIFLDPTRTRSADKGIGPALAP
jgi:hypothetical protein